MTEQRIATRRVSLDPAVFAVAAGTLFGLLLLRNPVTFGRVVYERGDFAANSVITADAKHFDLLVGNYSRLGFHHPGPAFFYVQAFGEWLLYDLLGAVPTPWNGQWVALLALNSVLLALVLSVVHSWTASRAATALCGAAMILYFATQPAILASAWMPNLYVAPFLLLLTAAASVAAGRVAHLPLLALAAGLLIHGHVSFLLFAPVLSGAAVVASLWTGRPAWRESGVAVAGAVAVLAVFALPIALNLLLHWPGDLLRYFEYDGARATPAAADVARYVLRYYASSPPLGALAAAAFLGSAAFLTRRLPAGPPRRFLTAAVCAAALATILFTGYVARAVDDLRFTYVGQFTRAIPLLLSLVCVAAAALRPGAFLSSLGRRPAQWLVTAVVIGALGVGSGAPALRKLPEHVPDMPEVMATLDRYTAGRPAVVDVTQETWPAFTALVVHGDRMGPRVCARDPWWEFMVTERYICTPDDLARGRSVRLTPTAPEGATLITPVDEAVLTAGS
ncbi:hypothetical protein RB614_30285 [Phytohabitans sp. ZYX-F-186]|uniref:Glycosyltransferase RgtA/B/C/D-like domain-containing protein n=1 Tax=Phytohabitans maris TaxID=3071409 RepID=A0ABU0ZP91_9ACTN|nr:hypothetical protein [Phytohabitans sp. ZYX-F-186]MDQ7908830.1 hypothetical protein [Phytohabitans sp. ZYX-F-186]